jgi:pimeloyl-ACP methyl ester carboxylesterase
MLRGYEANSTETSRTMRAMSPRGRRRARSALAGALLVIVAACTSIDGVSTDSASTRGPTERAPSTDSPPPTSAPTADAPTTTDDPPATSDPPASTDAASSPPTSGVPGQDIAAPIPGDPGTSIDWQRIDDHYDQGTLLVPVDYSDPSLGNFRLFLIRRRANDQDHRIGSLLINPGGPGASGASFAQGADFNFGTELLDRFDIIGWDPRGTYNTAPAIDCIEDYDHYLTGVDVTPDTPAARQRGIDLAKQFEDLCVEKNGPILQHVGTNDSARDIDSIRRALGEDKISYFGFSYGSELGATWATLFPDTVRAIVTDGAKDPDAGSLDWDRQQRVGFEHSLGLYLDDCAKHSDCAFHNEGFTREAFDELMDNIDAHPLPTKDGRPDLTRGMALQAVIMAMYNDALWDQLSDALAAAQKGDGELLLILYDTYFERRPDGTWPNLLEAFQVITCMDSADRPTVEEYDANALEISRLAPRIAPNTLGGYDCTWFPPSEHPRVPITGAGAGPIVVIGTTGDPATPLVGTEAMAAALQDGRLVVVDADQHTGYGTNKCVVDVVHEYLVDLKVPPARTEC